MIDIYVERGMEPDDAEVGFERAKAGGEEGACVSDCLPCCLFVFLYRCIDCLGLVERGIEPDDAEVRLIFWIGEEGCVCHNVFSAFVVVFYLLAWGPSLSVPPSLPFL